MPLVEYSSSESDTETSIVSHKPTLKRKRQLEGLDQEVRKPPPPLPASFHDLYATNVRTGTSDDPSLHGGRQRGTPHVVGNYAGHVYVEWYPSAEETSVISKVIHKFASCANVVSLLESDLGVPLPLHISLSRSLSLTNETKDDFAEVLGGVLRASAVSP